MDMDLETEAIEDFMNKEKEYFKFYRKPVNFIHIFLMFCNKNNELIHIKQVKRYLNSGIFNKDMFFSVIKNYKNVENKRYRFDSCNQYNFNILPENVENFIEKSNLDDYYFMNTIYSIEDIYFEDTIELFENMNSLYFLFKEEKSTNSSTKRVYIKDTKRKTRKVRENRKNILYFLSEID